MADNTLTPVMTAYIAGAALGLVVKERRRHVDELGYTEEHDDRHVGEELAAAAAFFLLPQRANQDVCVSAVSMHADEPCLQVRSLHELLADSAWDGIHCDDYEQPGLRADVAIDTRIGQLVKGTALALAELERWLRERELRDLAEKG